jgi:DNA-binding beta-propeller fold protein YncE
MDVNRRSLDRAGWSLALCSLMAAPLLAVPPLLQLPGVDGCVTETATGGACADGVALDLAIGVAVSPDGKNVYVASQISDAVAVFDREVVTGALAQQSGMSAGVSETGTGGACRDGFALDGAYSVTVSPDGRNVYAATTFSDSVVAFIRNVDTGTLSTIPGGCVSDSGGDLRGR